MNQEDKKKKPFRLIFASIVKDLFYLAGFFCVVYGVYQIHLPAAYITAGILFLLAAIPKKFLSKNIKPEK